MKELFPILIDDPRCPVSSAFKVLDGKWKLAILWVLTVNGTLRFQELKKCVIGITNTMLTSSLKDLEKDGLIERIQYNEIPPHVEYSLTEQARNLEPIFNEIVKWGIELKKLNQVSLE